MINMKILKKRGSREKGGRRKRNPRPMHLWVWVRFIDNKSALT
jgi:hypothetical protein